MTAQILGAHPHAVLLDEPDGAIPWFEALDPQDPTQSTALSDVLAKAASKYADPSLRFRIDPDGLTTLLPHITHLILKAPNLTYARQKISQLQCDVSVVSLIRDPRDVVASMAQLSQIPMVENQIRWMQKTPDLPAWAQNDLTQLEGTALSDNEKRALVWKIKTALATEFRSLGPRYTRVVYEELVRSPDAVLHLLSHHTGLSDHPNLRDHHSIFVGFGPGKTNRERSIDAASIGKSHATLTNHERSKVMKQAGEVARRYSRPVRLDEVPPPVILLGRGGSGTRLLSQMFVNAGVQIGNNLNVSYDSLEWIETLYAALEKKLALTSNPAELVLPEAAKSLRENAQLVIGRSDCPDPQDLNWGWKLPETMMLVPEVLHAFPKAKIIHLVRHPVTSSIRRTHKTSREDDNIGKIVLAAARNQIDVPKDHGLDIDVLNNAISWCLQVRSVTNFCRAELPVSQYLELRYEDLFTDWDRLKNQVSDFAGIDTDSIEKPTLDDARTQSFSLPDTRVSDVWRIAQSTGLLHGYDISDTGHPTVIPR